MNHHTLNLKRENDPPLHPRHPRVPRRFVWALLIAGAVLGSALYLFADMESGRWRAVFLTNDQVYFGKFRDLPFRDSVTLTEVYYLQVSAPLQPQGETGPELKLVKLGEEIHGPESKMVIPKANILFYESLKEDSPVVRTIREMTPRP